MGFVSFSLISFFLGLLFVGDSFFFRSISVLLTSLSILVLILCFFSFEMLSKGSFVGSSKMFSFPFSFLDEPGPKNRWKRQENVKDVCENSSPYKTLVTLRKMGR